jgi:hypothetical protein
VNAVRIDIEMTAEQIAKTRRVENGARPDHAMWANPDCLSAA